MNHKFPFILLGVVVVLMQACAIPQISTKAVEDPLPASYAVSSRDTVHTTARVDWREYFDDPYLTELIDSALVNNQEVNILLQRISRASNEIQARRGEYQPFVTAGVGADVDKVGRYTRNGAVEDNLNITEDREFPELLGNLQLGLYASWELDVWHKLRNAQQVSVLEYLASVEGRHFVITKLVAEIADSYYELIALDNQLDNLERNIRIQQDALQVVNLLQQAGRANSLAVRRFEAEVQKNQANIYDLRQRIAATENRINFLVGRPPQPIERYSDNFLELNPPVIETGVPSQLLENRPDIRQAELELAAARLNIEVARANFYPSFGIKAGLGYQAFNPRYLLSTPESLVLNLAGEAVAPLVNKKAIVAEYQNASASQIEAAYEYERTILNAYTEVATQLSNLDNLRRSYQLKEQQVASLTESIEIANQLFQSARADYMEVLLTQRDALEARMELIETKQAQLSAMVHLYQALGGGWR
ncbi:MAG: efflux transporter outer membrane subunit [Lewinella sp.]|nr:efflux transporter outer membrane subunit [Lewinella sp.]